MAENEEALNWCLNTSANYYYIKIEKLIQILTVKVVLSGSANFTLLAIVKDSSKLDNITTGWPYPDVNTPESYTFHTKFLENETITNTTLELIASDIQKNSQCTFQNSSCYILFSAYNFEQYYPYQLKVNMLPIITYITNQNLTFNTSTSSSVQSQAYTYFNINLDNCTECNLYFTVTNISDPEANLQLVVNQGQDNYPIINQSQWNTSTQFEDFTITNLSSGAYTVGVFSDKDINFTIIANKGQFSLVELQLGQNQIIKLNQTVPIIYLKLSNFTEEDLKLLFENVEDSQLEVYITNINITSTELIENLPNVDNAYWSSLTQPNNSKLIFWMAIGQENFCSNCTYLVKLEAKVTDDIEILVIPASSTMETELDNGQAIKDESNENQTTTYKYTTEESFDQNITVTVFEGNIVMKVMAVDSQDPNKYDWEQLNLTEVQTNDANGSTYQAVRKPKPNETYALFQVICESQNATTTECTSIYNIQISNTNNSNLLATQTYYPITLQINDVQTYQINSGDLDSFKIIFQYRNCTLISLIKDKKEIVTCQMTPSIEITYYLNSDAQKTQIPVDLQNVTIAESTNDFLVVNQLIQNATYTITLTNNQNDTVYCGIFYENSNDYNEVTKLSSRNSFQGLFYSQITISEIYQETFTTPHLLQVEIAQCSGFIHAFISDQFGDIQFENNKALKLMTNEYKYCGNLANQIPIIETPIYIKYHSTAESILTTKNEFQVQLNYVPEGVDNAYNCLYPNNNGVISIEQYENDIVFSVDQIKQTISCQNAFTYQIKGYWLALNKEQSQIECSLNIQQSKDVSYFHYYQINDNPSQKFSAMLSYKDFSAKPNDQFMVGIKVLIEVKYSAEQIANNYTFHYQTALFNCQPGQTDPTNPSKPDKSGLSGGEKAGIAIAVIIGVAAIGITLWLLVKRNQRRRDSLINFEEDSNTQIEYNKRKQNQDVELNYQGQKEKYNQFLDG